MIKLIILLFSLLAYNLSYSNTNSPNSENSESLQSSQKFKADSTIIFNSPHSLIDYDKDDNEYDKVIGVDLYFSNNGYGFGMFWEKNVNKHFSYFGKLFFATAKNTDELELYHRDERQYLVVDKINRLLISPLMLGGRFSPFADEISNSFSPYLSAGLGVALIYKMPYRENSQTDGAFVNVFSAMGDTEVYTSISAMLGLGFTFGIGGSHTSLNIEYYHIPFDKGLESVAGNPMKQFGGLNFSISVGKKY